MAITVYSNVDNNKNSDIIRYIIVDIYFRSLE